jgi:signal transduction histidine kinase
LGNAWKFTAKTAKARIEVGALCSDSGPIFFVRDDGVGFDGTRAKRLFEPFERMHSATEFPGAGIGLATVRRIIERHRGKIWAESTPGQGATFFFTLGAALSPKDATEQE